jgi:hypothetical protein
MYIILAVLLFICLGAGYYKFDKPHPRDYLIWDDDIIWNLDMRQLGM